MKDGSFFLRPNVMLEPLVDGRTKDHSRRLASSDFPRDKAIVNQFGCQEVYVYAMSQESWLNYVMSVKYTEVSEPVVKSNKLLDYCGERGLIAERLFGEKEILLPAANSGTGSERLQPTIA